VPLLDLSGPIEQSPPDAPDPLRTDIEFADHAAGAKQIEALLGVPPRLLRGGEGWSTETFTRLGTHNSTHLDAPWHYNSTIRGERAQTIDELPLDWFLGPGVVLDMTAKGDGEEIDVAEVVAELERIGHELGERDIVLVRTGRDAHFTELGYLALGPAVTAAATHWLWERGVRVMGIDAWGWDGPLHLQAQKALERDEPGIF
jgi:kynurenine formamidase